MHLFDNKIIPEGGLVCLNYILTKEQSNAYAKNHRLMYFCAYAFFLHKVLAISKLLLNFINTYDVF